jgi:hypothetical protein
VFDRNVIAGDIATVPTVMHGTCLANTKNDRPVRI